MVSTIALADAKAGLSSVVRDVSRGKAEYVITVRGVPQAMIVPVPKNAPKELKARGILAGKRPVASREAEKAAYAKALEEKYADPARCRLHPRRPASSGAHSRHDVRQETTAASFL